MNKKYNEPCVSLNLYVPQSRKEEIRELVRERLNGNYGWISVEDSLPEDVSGQRVEVFYCHLPYYAWYKERNFYWTLGDMINVKIVTGITHWRYGHQPPKSK